MQQCVFCPNLYSQCLHINKLPTEYLSAGCKVKPTKIVDDGKIACHVIPLKSWRKKNVIMLLFRKHKSA